VAKKKAAASVVKPVGPRTAGKPEAEMGQRIRLRRVELGMSQQELGEKVSVSFQQVQKYEKGINRIGAARLEQIAKHLRVPVTFFFGNGQGEGGVNSGKQQNEIESLLFLDSKFSLRLLRAYAAVKSQTVQRDIVRMVESIAGNLADD
jgi:transcriptional regulator with XRE-family HTH domain